MPMKNLLTPAGIEPGTFRFVAQNLNHWTTPVPDTLCTNYYDHKGFHKRGGNEHLLLQWRHAMTKQFQIKFVTYSGAVEL